MLLKSCLLSALYFSVLNSMLISKVSAVELKNEPKLQAVADQLVKENYYTQDELEVIFSKATVQKTVLDAMTSPAEYKFTWGKYRKLFLKEDRIQQGVEFWRQYQTELDRAEQEYGVPASVIVAIIGVESKFGRYKGKHKVLDSLVTLTVGFPRRSKFFASELKQFLILTKENDLAYDQILGSYAGAVGFPQFISSSYRNYAVDYSGDGVADLIDEPIDAIGSIANYFIKNGWKPGEPVTSKAHHTVGKNIATLANRKRKTRFTASDLRSKGAQLAQSINPEEKLNVLMLDASEIVPEPHDSNVYIVRAGDTACQIAEKRNVSCKLLLSLNKIGADGKIYRGQRLKLPVSADKPPTNKPSTNKTRWEVAKAENNDGQQVNTVRERFFFTHHNFYAITKYNHSVLYAMAVHELSKAIDTAKVKADEAI